MLTVAKWGDIPLLVVSHSDEDGRDWTAQSPARGDRHILQERGRRLQRTSCEILFCDEPGSPYLERFLAFQAAARSDQPRLFTHPINGAYLAVVTEFAYRVDQDERAIRAACTFLAQDPPQAVFALGAGVTAAVGPEQVGVLAEEVDEHLAAVGTGSTTPTACLRVVEAWAELEDPDARAIAIEAAAIAGEIDAMIATAELTSDLGSWAAYRAAVNLRYAVVRAAEAVTSESARVTEIVLTAPEPLRSICARVYGARAAEERARQVLKLNGLATPGLVPAGTRLKLPALGSR